jgi:hypothetical protein
MLLTKFYIIWPSGFRGKAVLEIEMNRNLVGSIYGRFSIKIAHLVTIHYQTWPPQAILVSDCSISKNLLLWNPSIDASYQVLYHLAKRFQRKSCFRNRPIRNKNYLRRPYLLMDQNEMRNIYREPSIDASYQVSYHLAKWLQRKSCFRNQYHKNSTLSDIIKIRYVGR